jgi:hypothetical protein
MTEPYRYPNFTFFHNPASYLSGMHHGVVEHPVLPLVPERIKSLFSAPWKPSCGHGTTSLAAADPELEQGDEGSLDAAT